MADVLERVLDKERCVELTGDDLHQFVNITSQNSISDVIGTKFDSINIVELIGNI